MKVAIKQIYGPWAGGWVLDKHMESSTFLGHNEWGHPVFDNKRTDVGEATYQLKYRSDWSQAGNLAKAIVDNIAPLCAPLGLVIPMPASKIRTRQPVTEVATHVAQMLQLPLFTNMLLKAPADVALKDLDSKEEKLKALQNRMSVHQVIGSEGSWNALVIDDLYDSGATMEVACTALASYPKIAGIYVAAFTGKHK